MADNKIPLKINVRKNNNEKSDNYGKYYPVVDRTATLTTRGLADHIAKHGTIYTFDLVDGILRKLSSCIPERVGEGTAVKIDGLGTFYPTAEGEKGGVSEEELAGYNPVDHVKGIHVRFYPENSKLDSITSRVFKDSVQMEANCVIETEKKTIAGKERTLKTLTPIADFVLKKSQHVDP